MFYLLKPCKTSAAYEAVPKKKLGIDIDECATKLSDSYEIVCNAKIMLVVKNGYEISIYPSGKLIIKMNSKEIAQNAADKIYALIGGDAEE